MIQDFNKLCKTVLALLFLLPVCQVVFGANDEVGEPDPLIECYPQQAITFSLPPIPEDFPICDGIIEPTDRATFDAKTGKVILPALRVNQKEAYVYSVQLNLLSAANAPTLRFEMTDYCLIQDPSSLPRNAEIATLILPPGQIHIPAIDIEGITYSADLELEEPSKQVWEESKIFTRKTKRTIFRVPRREVRQTSDKPKYPILFVHGLESSGETWKIEESALWNQKLTYGGNIYIRDKYHLFEQGNNANQNPNDDNLRRREKSDYLSFFEIKVKKEGKFVNLGEERNKKADFYTMNFSNNNDISFAAQGLELKAIVNKIVEWNDSDGVYVVAHSMGGLATRAYLQYFNDDKVKGLITMGTPHKGSRKDMLAGLVSSIKSRNADVVEQLQHDSTDLNMLNNECPEPQFNEACPLPGQVKYLFLVVRGEGLIKKYSDDKGDGVVPIDSQSINVKGKETQEVLIETKFGLATLVQVHTLEPSHSEIAQIVWDKLIEWSTP